jgi:hypothetical protein
VIYHLRAVGVGIESPEPTAVPNQPLGFVPDIALVAVEHQRDKRFRSHVTLL